MPGERATGEGFGVRRAAVSAFAAALIGIGLARFAYSPLIPALIQAGWFESSAAAYLGAANLAGYLLGALTVRRLAARIGPVWVIRIGVAAATLNFFACAWPQPFAWFFVCRFIAGAAGAAIVVFAAPVVMAYVPAEKRGVVTGAIFTGVGLGIAASGTLVPPIIGFGLTWAWLAIGFIALLLAFVAWGGWPPARGGGASTAEPEKPMTPAVRALVWEYGIASVGMVAHMVFLVDYVARELGQGIAQGGAYWVLFGLGAMCGPLLGGWTGDKIGFRLALRLLLATQTAMVILPVLWPGPLALTISSVVVGACVPGIVPPTLGRLQELLPGDAKAQARGWTLTTIAFAIGQAAGSYGFAALFAKVQTYVPIFWCGAAATLVAVAIDFHVARLARRASPS